VCVCVCARARIAYENASSLSPGLPLLFVGGHYQSYYLASTQRVLEPEVWVLESVVTDYGAGSEPVRRFSGVVGVGGQ
jgi:hypothetical protein